MPTIGWRSFDEAKVAVSRFIRGYYSLLRPHEIIARIAGNDTNVPRRGNGSWLTSATQEQQPTMICSERLWAPLALIIISEPHYYCVL